MTLVVDTGATKCVFFEKALAEVAPKATRWRTLRGLAAPTLTGVSRTRLVRVPSLEITTAAVTHEVEGIDAAVLPSDDLAAVLSRAVGESVDGLLGYSFLKRHRVAIDYPHRVLWLDPLPESEWNDRPYEYTQVGLQLERAGGAVRVMAVAENSPAASAGIGPGDEIVSIDGKPAASGDVLSLTRQLEGASGTHVELRVRRRDVERTYRLVRRSLL
jgi:S1-C subfamily serine protease